MNEPEVKIDCPEKVCFFKENEKYHHACLHCERNKKSENKDDDYHTVIQRSGY